METSTISITINGTLILINFIIGFFLGFKYGSRRSNTISESSKYRKTWIADKESIDGLEEEFKNLDKNDELVTETSSTESLSEEDIALATPAEFNDLDASKILSESTEKDRQNRKKLMTEWLEYVYRRIKEASDKGDDGVTAICAFGSTNDRYFDKGYDHELMMEATTKILVEKGFKVKATEPEPKSYFPIPRLIMIISWDNYD